MVDHHVGSQTGLFMWLAKREGTRDHLCLHVATVAQGLAQEIYVSVTGQGAGLDQDTDRHTEG